MTIDPAHLTRLLREWADGSVHARDELMPIVYRTLRWLEESFRRREPLLASIAVDPSWEALRSEPRFLALLQMMGLQEKGSARSPN